VDEFYNFKAHFISLAKRDEGREGAIPTIGTTGEDTGPMTRWTPCERLSEGGEGVPGKLGASGESKKTIKSSSSNKTQSWKRGFG